MNDRNPSSYAAEEEVEIDLRQLLQVLKKWRLLIIGMTLLSALCAALVSSFILSPIYQAETLLMVTQATEKLQAIPNYQQGDNLEEAVSTVSRMPVWTMNTYLGQIKSEALMKRIIDRLNLEELGMTAAGLSGMIEAEVVKDSNLIKVKVSNKDRVLASRIANTLSQEYLQLMTDKNQEQMSRSVTFLENQKKITDEDLRQAEDALKELQSQPRGVGVLETEFAKKAEDAVNYESRLKMAQVEMEQLSSGIYSLEEELSITPRTIVTDKWDAAAGSYRQSQEVNPLYLSVAQQLAEKKAALAEKQGEIAGLASLVGSMYQDLDQLQAELAEKRLAQDKLNREVERLKQTSETLAKKTTETQIVKSIDLGDTSVVVLSEASIPDHPVKPNKKLNTAIAMVLGLMIFTLLAFILEYLDNTLKVPDDISRELELPVLGMIPKMSKQNTRHGSYGG